MRILPRKIIPYQILFLLVVLLLSVFSLSANAKLSRSQKTQVSAKVGELILNISGWIAPYASVVLTTTDGVFIRATVADTDGNFFISGVSIKKGFSGFCLTAVDYRRLGESVTCLTIPPAQEDVNKVDIFLPPTLGFARTEVAEGQEVIAFGMTMRKANVSLTLDNGDVYETKADKDGFYQITIKKLKSGIYNVYAVANLEGKDSLKPTKFKQIKVLSKPEQVSLVATNLWKEFLKLLTSLGLGPLWLAIPILILIIILLRKLYPRLFTSIKDRLIIIIPKSFKKKKKMHHAWWMGY